jgi:hypothetical protein
MEATALSLYHYLCKVVWDGIHHGKHQISMNNEIRDRMKKIETFILWHYQNGSKYDTPFWKYAKSLAFNPDDEFKSKLEQSRQMNFAESCYADKEFSISYADWGHRSFKVWDNDM